MTRRVRPKIVKQSLHVRKQRRKTRRIQKQRGGLVSSLRMIQLLDIMDRRFLTKVESNGFETNAKILKKSIKLIKMDILPITGSYEKQGILQAY